MKNKNYLFLALLALLFSGCFNRNGVSLKYYSDCDEYYDAQGYYHKDCGKDDFISYDEMKSGAKKGFNKAKYYTKKAINSTSNALINAYEYSVDGAKNLIGTDDCANGCK